MRSFRFILFILLLGGTSPASAQSWLWAREDVPDSSAFGDPIGDHTIATDHSGNVYITGLFSGTLNFGTFSISSSQNSTYLVKYNSAGQPLWARQSTANMGFGFADGIGLTCDRTGNVCMSGQFNGTVSFGAFTLISNNTTAFLVKYDPNGNVLWARSAPIGINSYAFGEGDAADDLGNIYMTGRMKGTVSFGSHNLSSPGDCFFLVKYDPNGTALWVRQSVSGNGSSMAEGISMALDATGNPYVTGSFSGTVSFGAYSVSGLNTNNSFLVKLDPSGNMLWARPMTASSVSGVASSASVSVDARGNAYVTGLFRGLISFGMLTLAGGRQDLFLAKYNSAGQVIWAKMDQVGSDSTIWSGYSVVSDTLAREGGYLLASGFCLTLHPTFIYDRDTFRLNVPDPAADVLFSFDSLGNIRCGSIITEGPEDDGSAIAVDRSGRYIYLTGDIFNPVAIGNDSLVYGNDQVFIARWENCISTLSSVLQGSDACAGACTGIAVAKPSGGSAPYTFSWSPSGGNTDTARALCAGTYTCFVSDANGTILRDTVTIRQDLSPLTVTAAPGGTIAPGHDTTLSVVVSGGSPAYTYAWNGVPGGNTFTVNPMLTTSYNVTVTDSLGCKVSRTILVNVEPCAALFIPNAFSPNQDGQNDKECIRGLECISNLDFSIYDRWGERVFETTDPNRCWDGTYNGREMESAVYVYYLKGTLLNGQAFEKKGNISLVR